MNVAMTVLWCEEKVQREWRLKLAFLMISSTQIVSCFYARVLQAPSRCFRFARIFFTNVLKNWWRRIFESYTQLSRVVPTPLVLEYKNKVYNKNMWRINFFERYSTFKETKQIKMATKHGMRHSIGPLRCYNEIQEQISKASIWIIQCLCHLHYCI